MTNLSQMHREREEETKPVCVEFAPTKEALQLAYEWDVETYSEAAHVDWISLLSYGAVVGNGTFDKRTQDAMDDMANAIRSGKKTMEQMREAERFADYYRLYEAVLAGMVGEYKQEIKNSDGSVRYAGCYGLKAFSPIADGFSYEHYDDFGAGRSYGYERKHLGHDMMGELGTPIVAVESGYVEALGWNRYGGWRVGIRSADGKRYYYYAHLRQDSPYAEGLEKGNYVTAGEVIGYMGRTGYSVSENVSNIETVHLHLGIELIFDEKDRAKGEEIWIDCYALTNFLNQNRSKIVSP